MDSKVLLVTLSAICFLLTAVTASEISVSDQVRSLYICQLLPQRWRNLCILQALGYNDYMPSVDIMEGLEFWFKRTCSIWWRSLSFYWRRWRLLHTTTLWQACSVSKQTKWTYEHVTISIQWTTFIACKYLYIFILLRNHLST